MKKLFSWLKQRFLLIIFKIGGRFYSPKIVRDPKLPYLGAFSEIKSRFLLFILKEISFTNLDVRASWFGPGFPKIVGPKTKFQNFALWAHGHLMMYFAFFPSLERVEKLKKVLDVGSGVGYDTVCLSAIFPRAKFVGLDYDREAISVARAFNKGKNVEYINQSIFDYKTDTKFDCIFAMEVLEHIPYAKHDRFIAKCLNLLSPNGRLFISTPNALDEKDGSYSHVGLLNRARAHEFFKKYKQNIVEGFFVDNKKISGYDINRFVVKLPLENFEQKGRNLSHFHIVMKKI